MNCAAPFRDDDPLFPATRTDDPRLDECETCEMAAARRSSNVVAVIVGLVIGAIVGAMTAVSLC